MCFGTFLLVAGCLPNSQKAPAAIVALDEPKGKVHQVSVHSNVVTNDIPDNDIVGIFSALSRTPNVEYEVLSIETFPRAPHPFPVAASVKVRHHYLYLCKGTANEWHVFRTSEYWN